MQFTGVKSAVISASYVFYQIIRVRKVIYYYNNHTIVIIKNQKNSEALLCKRVLFYTI